MFINIIFILLIVGFAVLIGRTKEQGKRKQIIMTFSALVLIVILYLFALNSRYSDISPQMAFDKWTGSYIEPMLMID